jgi:hypothetical protein
MGTTEHRRKRGQLVAGAKVGKAEEAPGGAPGGQRAGAAGHDHRSSGIEERHSFAGPLPNIGGLGAISGPPCS